MITPIRIQINTPCAQPWDQMDPVSGGRFCEACERKVIDFTSMTDQQIKTYLSQASGPSCGRLRNSQLNRYLIGSFRQEPGRRWYWMPMLATALLVSQQDFSQGGALVSGRFPRSDSALGRADKGKVNHPPESLPSDSTGESWVISGQIRGAVKDPVPGASVRIREIPGGVWTDSQGHFSIAVHTRKRRLHLIVESVGYVRREFTVKRKKGANQSADILLTLDMELITVGLIAITESGY